MTQAQKQERMQDKRDYLTALHERRDNNNARILEVQQAMTALEAEEVTPE